MNQVSLIGRISRDIKVNETKDGIQVLNNAIAVTRRYGSKQQVETDFIPFVVWGKRSEIIMKYCQKGDMIGLDGRLQSGKYEADDGRTIYVIELVVEGIHLLRQGSSRTSTESSSSKTISAEDIAKIN